jgi:hypothetical protein
MSEGQAEGVTQDAGQPQSDIQDSAPESIETGEAQASEGGSEPQGDQPKSKEYNFKQMRESLSRLETERKQWLTEKESLQGAAAIDQLLRQDPKAGLQKIAKALNIDLKTLIDAQQSELPQINLEGYDPETGRLLKFLHDRASKVEQLEQWKNEMEQRFEQTQRQTQETQLQQNVKTIDEMFRNDLIKNGYWDKDAKGKTETVELIESAILERLARHGDPRLATGEQYQEEASKVFKALSAHKNQTLQNTVTKSVPSSGSRNGAPTTAKPAMTKEQRLAIMEETAYQMPTWNMR